MTAGSAPPIFVIGFQRSGTTLLRMMLDSHPDLAIPLDTVGLWASYAGRLDAYGDLATEADVRKLVDDLLDEERIRLWEVPLSAGDVLGVRSRPGFPGVIDAFHTAYARAHGKRRWGDKDPGNIRRLHLVHRWFPDGRIVHIIRDGRDACLSLVRQPFGPADLLQCAEYWRENVQWVRRQGRVLPAGQYVEVRYEDLVRDPEGELRRLCPVLDLDFDPAMLEYYTRVDESIPREKRRLWELIDRPPQPDNIDRWRTRMSRAARLCFEKRAGPVLADLGYEVMTPRPPGGYAYELGVGVRRVFRAVQRRWARVFS